MSGVPLLTILQSSNSHQYNPNRRACGTVLVRKVGKILPCLVIIPRSSPHVTAHMSAARLNVVSSLFHVGMAA
jgi:hypothetical protein